MDKLFTKHLKDLSDRAYNDGRYTYTSFLDLEEQSQLESIKTTLYHYMLFGGMDACERKIAVFGNQKDFGYAPEFPVTILKITPLNQKFSDELTHRDFLGAIMNLNIERCNIGDIVVKDNCAFVFVLRKMTGVLCNELTRIKHTSVECKPANTLPEGELYKTTEKAIIVSSLRLDCILCSVYNLSRSKVNTLFEAQKIFVNGKQTTSNSFIPNPGDIVSLRGSGRFKINEVTGNTKKGRIVLSISIFN